jgi:hypothetical protein
MGLRGGEPPRSRLGALLLASMMLCLTTQLVAQGSPSTLPEDAIKAGFLLNFTHFVEWNESLFPAPASPFILCIAGDPHLAALLAQAAAGKTMDGRGVSIRAVKGTDDLHACHILYIGAAEERHAAHILHGLPPTGILSVGESPDFNSAGGILNFLVVDNRVKLELDLNAATRAGLKISAKLIAVSRLTAPSTARSN